jgi:hypothetical protein
VTPTQAIVPKAPPKSTAAVPPENRGWQTFLEIKDEMLPMLLRRNGKRYKLLPARTGGLLLNKD